MRHGADTTRTTNQPAPTKQIDAMTSDEPQNGEWWVCVWEEDALRLSGAEHVPIESRFVAYRQVWPDGTGGWCKEGDHLERHWIIAIRKVDLS
jgi:hypothetical protein